MIEYPPPYERLVWDYNHANQNAMVKALDQIDWNFLFFNKNVHQQISILNKTLIFFQISFQTN